MSVDSLVALAESAPANELRPCRGCVRPCPCARRSTTCTCQCTPSCSWSVQFLAPVDVGPLEPHVVPLAFELAALRCFPLVSACEGHPCHVRTGGAWRHEPSPWPKLSFLSSSLTHVETLADQARLAEATWGIIVGRAASLGWTAFTIMPVHVAPELPLLRVQEEARALAMGLAAAVRAHARRALERRGSVPVDPRPPRWAPPSYGAMEGSDQRSVNAPVARSEVAPVLVG